MQNVTEETGGFDTTLDEDLIVFLMEAMIRYQYLDEDSDHWEWVKNQVNLPRASDILKLLKSVRSPMLFV